MSDAMGTDVPSLCTFLEILSGNGPEYDSDGIDCYAPPCMCYHIDSEVSVDKVPELTLLDQGPRSHASRLREEGGSPTDSVGGPGRH